MDIAVDSEPGSCTTIKVFLPRVAPAPTKEAYSTGSASRSGGQKAHIAPKDLWEADECG